jgi:hypothetical protein
VRTPSLLELQRAVARGSAGEFVVPDGLTPDSRLGIYRNTFFSVLAAALRISYPTVHRLVGAEFFEGAARVFAEERPPESAYLNEYGAALGDFLARFAPAASLPYLPDVARLEWAVNCALHAPDVPSLDLSRLRDLDDCARALIRFVPHPSLRLVRAEFSADLIWRAVLDQDDEALAAVDPQAGPAWLLVERLVTGVEVHRLGEPAWRFAAALCSGRELCAVLEESPCEEAQGWLAEHLRAGRFTDFRLTETRI